MSDTIDRTVSERLADRRNRVRLATVGAGLAARPPVNGIENIEVAVELGVDPADDTAILTVEFIHPLDGTVQSQPEVFLPRHVSISGGDRVRQIRAVDLSVDGGAISITVAPLGDTSQYRLHMNNESNWLDPLLDSIPFSFAVDCDSVFDCRDEQHNMAPHAPPPALDYLARDFESFRQVLRDRMSTVSPGWTDNNPADLGVVLLELLADAGDRLSYRQDVIATEAYLDTARSRVSVDRHLRLIDRRLGSASAARVPIHIEVTSEATIRAGARFWTAPSSVTTATVDPQAPERAAAAGAIVFESSHELRCVPANNAMELHTWAGAIPRLSAGCTTATLADPHHSIALAAGDFIVLEQSVDPVAGPRRLPDPALRHLVQLKSVVPDVDPVANPIGGRPLPVLTIEWSDDDALPFDLPLVAAPSAGIGPRATVAVARANIMIADEGRTVRQPTVLNPVPAVDPRRPRERFSPRLDTSVVVSRPPISVIDVPIDVGLRDELDVADQARAGVGPHVYRMLQDLGIAGGAATVERSGEQRWSIVAPDALVKLTDRGDQLRVQIGPSSARQLMLAADRATSRRAQVQLHEQEPGHSGAWVIDNRANVWHASSDLLSAGRATQAFVVETDNDMVQQLRFGDDRNGKAPNAGTQFVATTRVGGGVAGNVGRDTITQGQFGVATLVGTTDVITISTTPDVITTIRNPLAAVGGTDAEEISLARVRAPETFVHQLRAVTLEDYASRLEAHPRVQRAVVSRRWTGTWPTLFCTVDIRSATPTGIRGGAPTSTSRPTLDDETEAELTDWLEPWRTMGHDVEIDGPIYVPVELHLCVQVEPSVSRRSADRRIRALLGSGRAGDSTLGLFHPDTRTFGQPVTLSEILATVHRVAGVIGVDVLAMRRQGTTDSFAIAFGSLVVGPQEILELSDDPDYPNRGSLRIDIEGGR